MPKKISAGILLYKIIEGELLLFLVHPGGPIFKNKDEGHWGIPKGEVDDNEDYFTCALREVKEEIGLSLEGRNMIPLESIVQKGGKVVYGWACRQDDDFIVDTSGSIVEMRWPPAVGKVIRFPEIDEAQFFSSIEAKRKIKSTQVPLIERLESYLKDKSEL